MQLNGKKSLDVAVFYQHSPPHLMGNKQKRLRWTSTHCWQAKKNAVLKKTLKIRPVLPAKRGKIFLISEDEEFSLASSDNEELSPSELTDEKGPAEHSDGPSCSFVAGESLSGNKACCSENDLHAMRKQTDHPMTVVLLESEETTSSDNSISFHSRVRDTNPWSIW